jgi:fatty-acyl-CoA synthase
MLAVDWLARREQLSPNKIALIDTLDGGREISYREWNHSANRTAHFLRGLGAEKGTIVAVLAKNCVAYLDIWFALGKLGAVLHNLNWRLATTELAALVNEAEPRILIYGPEFTEQVGKLREQTSSVRRWVALEEIGPASPDDALFTGRNRCSAAPPAPIPLQMEDPWVICYTGGTTGLPKGAILTHGNITWNSINTVMSWGLSSEDVTILNAPLFHTGGLNVFTAPLVHLGGTSIVCREFDVDQLFDLLRAYPVTLYFGVPTMFIAMQRHPRWAEVDFSRFKLLISGGAPCPMPVFERFWSRGVNFKTGYGLTEAGPNTFWLPPEDVRRKPGAVGFPLFHVDVRVLSEAGEETPAGQVGELVVRGPHVTPGYLKQPEATAEVIRDGWLHTGDLAVRDEEGYYYIVGRLKEMIISGGENIYPAEVESVLAAHPAVAEVALIPVPDDRWGEVGCAFVVAGDGEISEGSLREFVSTRLARYKTPRHFRFVEALPKTGAGKVDKQLLWQRYNKE